MLNLKPLNPLTNRYYVAAIDDTTTIPADVRATVAALIETRNTAPEEDIDRINAAIVDELYWYALRPDVIASDVMRHWHIARSPVTVDHATLILAALAEQGYPITGNGAPEVVWAAARYWATAATRHITYVSLGDCRGFLPRPVQHDQPGRSHPMQRAALTFGPADDDASSRDYMRRHTRRLIRVRAAE